MPGVPWAAISMPATLFDLLLSAIYARETIMKVNLIRLIDGDLCGHCPNCPFGRY